MDNDPQHFLDDLDDPEYDRVESPDPDITGGAIFWLCLTMLVLIAVGICVGIWAFFEANT